MTQHNIVSHGVSPHNGEYWYACSRCGASDWIASYGTYDQLNFFASKCRELPKINTIVAHVVTNAKHSMRAYYAYESYDSYVRLEIDGQIHWLGVSEEMQHISSKATIKYLNETFNSTNGIIHEQKELF